MLVSPDSTDESPMAKKKAEPKKFGRPPLEEGAKTAKFTLRITPGWLTWFQDFATSKRKDKAVIAREAIARMAKEDGFKPPPEE